MRRRLVPWLAMALSSAPAALFVACASEQAKPSPLPIEVDDNGRKEDAGGDPGPDDSGAQVDTGPTEGRVFAHTEDTLYLFEPISRKLTKRGKLGCLTPGDRVLDIAVNRVGEVYGTTDANFIKINPLDGTCTVVAPAPGNDLPNSLSFVPAGTLDPTSEALVGYAYDAQQRPVRYVRVNTSNGQMIDIGNLNAPAAATKYISSGDLVSLRNAGNKTYLTVRQEPLVTGAPDLLVEVDPKTGLVKLPPIGDTKQSHIYGFGFWAGKGYGFSDDGHVTELNMATGASTVLLTLSNSDGGAGIPWFGAGVTTDAPLQ